MDIVQKIKEAKGLNKIKLLKEFKSMSGLEKIKALKEFKGSKTDDRISKEELLKALERIKEVLDAPNGSMEAYEGIEGDVNLIEENEKLIEDEPLFNEVVALFNEIIERGVAMDSIFNDGGDLFKEGGDA